ncbi:MAG TPA: glucose-1-phosphate adenylyltransferase family protein [Ardenticatenaceae bacterium]|jgi:glucose-1-phosphate adenylyltransferase
MKPNHKVLALILAGGKGSRLGILTSKRSKPAVPFAGVYRLIDISLSNILHSGLTNVWIIEQYHPHLLNEHLANGRPWDLDRTHGGLRILPPYEGTSDKEGFAQGNADAIYQHLSFIRQFGPELILVLSADHIYLFDFGKLIARHEETGADLTMVTTEVPQEEASRFGVVQTNDEGRVTRFDYKPDEPQGNLVTAEIFLYNADVLLNTLQQLADEGDGKLKDYGHELLPRLVEQGNAYEYRHEGYWRDAGTIESYWQLHMDLLADEPELDLDSPNWPIFTRDPQRLPAHIFRTGSIENSLISSGCIVKGHVSRSVLSPGVIVEEGAVIRDSIILHDARIETNARVEAAIVDENTVIGRGATVGEQGEGKDSPTLTLVGKNVRVAPGDTIKAGTELEPDSEE